MNARELLAELEKMNPLTFDDDERERYRITHRALRLLAVIESAEGETPETDAFVSVRFGQMVCSHAELRDLARRLERERNGLAARVGELEPDAERYRWLRRHQICYGDDDKGNARVTVDFTVGPWSLSPVSADEAIDAARIKP